MSQSCATCHNPDFAFVDPRDNQSGRAASLGDNGTSLGGRNAPTASYASFIPKFRQDKKTGDYSGGLFHDGRVSSLEAQAGGPPLNPIEMGMLSKAHVAERVRGKAIYVKQFKSFFGDSVFADDNAVFDGVKAAIASFERSRTFAPFDSKYDRELRGEYEFSELEELGKALFFSNNNTNCSTCHVLHGPSHRQETFSNYSYHNIHVPENLNLQRVNGIKTPDRGLANNPAASGTENIGKFRVLLYVMSP